MMRYSERGSALLMILIMTVLFAALAYAVSEGFRVSTGTQTSVTRDKAKLDATSVLDFAQAINTSVQEMKVNNGGAVSSIDFVIPGDEPAFSTAPNGMKIFHPEGGGVTYIPVWSSLDDPSQATATDWFFISNAIDNVGSAEPELLMTLMRVPLETCAQLNQNLTGSDTVPSVTGNVVNMFETAADPIDSVNCAACDGVKALCVENSGVRAFYYVLDRG